MLLFILKFFFLVLKSPLSEINRASYSSFLLISINMLLLPELGFLGSQKQKLRGNPKEISRQVFIKLMLKHKGGSKEERMVL